MLYYVRGNVRCTVVAVLVVVAAAVTIVLVIVVVVVVVVTTLKQDSLFFPCLSIILLTTRCRSKLILLTCLNDCGA